MCTRTLSSTRRAHHKIQVLLHAFYFLNQRGAIAEFTDRLARSSRTYTLQVQIMIILRVRSASELRPKWMNGRNFLTWRISTSFQNNIFFTAGLWYVSRRGGWRLLRTKLVRGRGCDLTPRCFELLGQFSWLLIWKTSVADCLSPYWSYWCTQFSMYPVIPCNQFCSKGSKQGSAE
jgi:hypothetical protein